MHIRTPPARQTTAYFSVSNKGTVPHTYVSTSLRAWDLRRPLATALHLARYWSLSTGTRRGSPGFGFLPRCPAFPPALGCRHGGCRWPTAQRAPSERKGKPRQVAISSLPGLCCDTSLRPRHDFRRQRELVQGLCQDLAAALSAGESESELRRCSGGHIKNGSILRRDTRPPIAGAACASSKRVAVQALSTGGNESASTHTLDSHGGLLERVLSKSQLSPLAALGTLGTLDSGWHAIHSPHTFVHTASFRDAVMPQGTGHRLQGKPGRTSGVQAQCPTTQKNSSGGRRHA